MPQFKDSLNTVQHHISLMVSVRHTYEQIHMLNMALRL